MIYDNMSSGIEPYNNRGLWSQHKEHYNIIISEEWYIFHIYIA